MLSRPNGRFHHLKPGQSRAHGRGHRGLGSPVCFACTLFLGWKSSRKSAVRLEKFAFPPRQRGSLITVWLEVRVLPAPPRTPMRTGVSRSLTNSPQFAGVFAVQMRDVRSLPPAEVATAWILAPSLWALQTRSWRQTGVAREDRRNQIDKPSIAYWRDHSAGASRRRVTPMPRGNRPSTAACTSSGARNASEIVILTCRMLHFSRAAI